MTFDVILAKARVHVGLVVVGTVTVIRTLAWMPAFAGMTVGGSWLASHTRSVAALRA